MVYGNVAVIFVVISVVFSVLATLQLLGVKWFDKWLDRKLETHKASLGALTEHLKHDLQREMLKAELATSTMHEVYGKLWVRVVRAHGAVAGLVGGRFAPSYDDYDAEDFAQLLRGLVHDFVEKSLEGSVSPFLAYLAQEKELTEEEIGIVENASR